MLTTAEVARDYTAMMRAGQFEAAGNRFWAKDISSIEPADQSGSLGLSVSGIDAARRRCKTRFATVRVDNINIDGPFVTGNQFALFLDLFVIDPAAGALQPLTEIAIYTVRTGQIVEERHFHD